MEEQQRERKDVSEECATLDKSPECSSSSSPSASPTSTYSDCVKVNFYYGGSIQRLGFSRQSKKNQVVKELLRLLRLSNKLAKEATFIDEEGDPIILNPKHLVNDARVTLTFPHVAQPEEEGKEKEKKKEKKEKRSAPEEKGIAVLEVPRKLQRNRPSGRHTSQNSWAWDANWNEDNCGYTLSSNNLVISFDDFSTPIGSMPILISNRAFKKGTGVYKWTVNWATSMSYHGAGIICAKEKGPALRNFGNGFNSVHWFNETCDLGEVTSSFVLDMDNLVLTRNGKRFENIPTKVYAAICFKAPHRMRATLKVGE